MIDYISDRHSGTERMITGIKTESEAVNVNLDSTRKYGIPWS
jgi:hypothetical protein